MTDATGTSAATHCPNCGEAIKYEGEHWEQGGYYCRPSSNRVPTRERLAEIAACVISGESDWGVPSMDDTDPWEIADLILKEFGRAIPNSVAEVCGAPNPYGTSNCGQPRGHEGDHRPADAAPNSVRAYDGQGCARCGFPIHADDTSEEQDMSPAPPIRRHRDCLEAAYQAGRRNA